MPPHRILIDCDPGRDDALAIALALASPQELDLAGLTAVAGNVPLPLTYRNARFICDLCGFPGVPVTAGAAGPLARQPVTGTRAHGESGLEGMDVEVPMPAVQAGARDRVPGTDAARRGGQRGHPGRHWTADECRPARFGSP